MAFMKLRLVLTLSKEVQIVYRLFLVNCHLLHMPRLPSQLASNISMNVCVQVFTNSTALNPK